VAAFNYDVELFISDVRNILTSNLDAKITAINAEKASTAETGDDFAIDLIPSSAYYFHQIPAVWSYKQFLIYGLQDLKINEAQHDNHVQKVSLFVEVALIDKGEKQNESQIFKLLRYTRSLQEIFLENFDKIRSYGKLTVDSLPPTLIEVNGKRLKSAGVVVSASFSIR